MGRDGIGLDVPGSYFGFSSCLPFFQIFIFGWFWNPGVCLGFSLLVELSFWGWFWWNLRVCCYGLFWWYLHLWVIVKSRDICFERMLLIKSSILGDFQIQELFLFLIRNVHFGWFWNLAIAFVRVVPKELQIFKSLNSLIRIRIPSCAAQIAIAFVVWREGQGRWEEQEEQCKDIVRCSVHGWHRLLLLLLGLPSVRQVSSLSYFPNSVSQFFCLLLGEEDSDCGWT